MKKTIQRRSGRGRGEPISTRPARTTGNRRPSKMAMSTGREDLKRLTPGQRIDTVRDSLKQHRLSGLGNQIVDGGTGTKYCLH